MRALLKLLLPLGAVWVLLIPSTLGAENQTRDDAGQKTESREAERATPSDVVSKQTLVFPDRTLHFTASIGFVRLFNDRDRPEADIEVTSYTMDVGDPKARPIAFVLNGGPGIASAWLQMGAVGPWRIPLVPAPSSAADPKPNADTWLDFTDLVFIDPPGTGYGSIIGGDEDRKRMWSVDGDVDALSQVIRRWVDKAGRGPSPKYLVGESYGAFRIPRLSRRLAEHDGVGVRGLLLLSPVLDFGNRSSALDLLGYATLLPSMTAIARASRGESVSQADLADVENYASGAFVSDVWRGVADPAATDRVIDRVSSFTALDRAAVARHRGLIDGGAFVEEHDRSRDRVDSLYDGTVSLPNAYPGDQHRGSNDPVWDGLQAPITEAIVELYRRLGWHPPGPPYRLFDQDAAQNWDYGRGPSRPQSLNALRQALALDPNMRAVIAHGLFDLVCPYAMTKLLLNQIPPSAGGNRISFVTYPGGHMFYMRDAARSALRVEAAKLIGGSEH